MLSTFDISLENRDGIKLKRWINTKFHNNGAQTRYSRYLSPSRSNWSGIKFKKIFTTKLIFSINCEKKLAFPFLLPRKFNRYKAKEGFVTFLVSIPADHAGKVKFLRGDDEKMAARVGWRNPLFFLSNKSWRVKVSTGRGNGIIPSGKVEIIKISNFQTGARRQKTYDSAAWDGQCRGFPIERANFAPTSNLENWKPLKKKGKKEKLFPLWCLVASPKNNFLSCDHSTAAWLRVRARGCGLLKGFRDSVFFLSLFSFFFFGDRGRFGNRSNYRIEYGGM